jgi:hypothetical protein
MMVWQDLSRATEKEEAEAAGKAQIRIALVTMVTVGRWQAGVGSESPKNASRADSLHGCSMLIVICQSVPATLLCNEFLL